MDKSEKQEAAMQRAVEIFLRELEAPMEHAFELGGSTHPLTCSAECALGNAQRMKRAAARTLEVARSEEDYYLEQAAHRLATLFEQFAEFAVHFAAVKQLYPEGFAALAEYVPAFAALGNESEEMWAKISQTMSA